jgi:hypothetical protein
MASYGDLAWTYSEEDLGIDPDTKLKFVPNKKELDLFKQEKTDMYKGTWMVCFIYGLSAVILLSIIFFTEWGRTYVYDKFLPAVITYVLGAIFIIIYLVTSIFSLMPRKIGKRNDAMPICPDYWKLTETTEAERKDIVKNIQTCRNGTDGCTSTAKKGEANNQYILKNSTDPVINATDSQILKYKCVPDSDVFGFIDEYHNQKVEISSMPSTTFKKTETATSGKDTHIYRELGESGDQNESIKKYAQVSGIYKNEWDTSDVGTNPSAGTTANQGLFDNTISIQDTAYNYKTNPLVCNVVYPGIIGAMEDTKNSDKLRCEYADKCGISWSKLDCLANNK